MLGSRLRRIPGHLSLRLQDERRKKAGLHVSIHCFRLVAKCSPLSPPNRRYLFGCLRFALQALAHKIEDLDLLILRRFWDSYSSLVMLLEQHARLESQLHCQIPILWTQVHGKLGSDTCLSCFKSPSALWDP